MITHKIVLVGLIILSGLKLHAQETSLKEIIESKQYSIRQAAKKKLAKYYPSPADWRGEVIYQIITDRFENGDPSNDRAHPLGQFNPKKHNTIHGGDFRGIQKQLGYIKQLGCSAIWISPVLLNSHGQYHGYHTYDFGTVDPHWGTLEELQELVRRAHQKDIKVILDVICNHTADLIKPDTTGKTKWKAPPEEYPLLWRDEKLKYPPPLDNLNWYHGQGGIDWQVPEALVLGELYSLDDLKTERREVRAYLTQAMMDLITATDCDGFRVDTTRHVEESFWVQWCPAIKQHARSLGKDNFLIFGESAEEEVFKLLKYLVDTDGHPIYESLIDFPERKIMERVFAGQTLAPTALKAVYEQKQKLLPKHARDQMVRILDNHDMARFLTVAARHQPDRQKRLGRLRVALFYLLTSGGIPVIYYGTEQGFEGGGRGWDESREDMFDGAFEFGPSEGNNFNRQSDMYQFVREILTLRRDYITLQKGKTTWVEVEGQAGLAAYVREFEKQAILMVLNTNEQEKRTLDLDSLEFIRLTNNKPITNANLTASLHNKIITIPAQGIGLIEVIY